MRGRLAGLGCVAVLFLLVAGVAVGDPGSDVDAKRRLDARIARLQGEIARAGAREGILTTQLSAVSAELRAAQADVDAQQARVAALEADLSAARARLSRATALLAERTAFLRFATGQAAIAQHRLERRLREIYMRGTPDVLAVLAATESLSDLLDQVEYVERVGRLDRRLAGQARHARDEAARARLAARRARDDVAATERVLSARTAEAEVARDRLLASRDTLAAARQVKAQALGSLRESKRSYLDEVEALQAQSAALAARIRAAQQTGPGFEPPAGGSGRLQWPVSGPVTSGFGLRWGRMHEGIDIAVPSGTPVHAAGPGRVIYAGWLGGYGNLVVVDHGGGLSTAYAHNTSVVVSVGQEVATGSVLAYSGSTGHSTGPHVHFEVRVGGAAVDPLRYL